MEELVVGDASLLPPHPNLLLPSQYIECFQLSNMYILKNETMQFLTSGLNFQKMVSL